MERAATLIVQKLVALPEPVMREIVLVETLAAMPPSAAVALVADLCAAAQAGRAVEALIAVSALAGALGRLSYDLAATLYTAAKGADRPEVARLLLSAAQVMDEAPPEPERYLPAARRALTLGERKALAHGRRRDILVGLLGDPDASVIRALLENPRLTEKDVVSAAARRPARADVQRAIFASRWCARYHVKRALVMNPGTPSDVAVRLLPSLVESDRRQVAVDPNLAPVVREAATASCPR